MRSLGVVEQTFSNWVKAHREGKLKEVSGKTGVTAEQMEISRLRAELARVKMERDILGKRRHTLQKARSEVCLHRMPSADLADLCAVPGARGERIRLPSTSGASSEDRYSARTFWS
jgi:Transposase